MAPFCSGLRIYNTKTQQRWSSSAFMLVAVAVFVLENGMVAVAAPTQSTTRIQGRLVSRTAHVRDIWKLVTSSDDVFTLPGQPLDSIGNPITPGSTVSMDCIWESGRAGACIRVAGAAVTRAAAPVRSVDIQLRLLVMVVSLQGACIKAGASVDRVQQAYSSELGYVNFLKNCSYGKVTFDPAAGGVTVISTPAPCNAAILRCDEDSVAMAARASAIRTFGATWVASFTRFTYVLPIGLDTCGWVGLADLPGVNTWYAANGEGIFNKGTVLQETLHNFGIYHGWKDGAEYADNSTAMGCGLSCPSAPELWRLGWATVLEILDSASLPARVFRTFQLPATSVNSTKNMIKIKPDWLGTAYTKNVYLALRANVSGDRDLDQAYNFKISVHQLDNTIDNSFWASGDPKVSALRTIDPRGSAELSAFKLLIKAGDLSKDGTGIDLRVCRYAAVVNECKSADDWDGISGGSGYSGNATNTASFIVTSRDYDYESSPPPPPTPSPRVFKSPRPPSPRPPSPPPRPPPRRPRSPSPKLPPKPPPKRNSKLPPA